MKLFVTGLGNPEPTVLQLRDFFCEKLKTCRGGHRLVPAVTEADTILFLWGTQLTQGLSTEEKQLLEDRGEDCFAYDGADRPLPFFAGIYTALPRSLYGETRARTFCYPVENRWIEEARAGADKKYFFTFMGGSTSWARKYLYRMNFDSPEVLIEDTSRFQEWNPHQSDWESDKERYARILVESEFVLCPRGAGVGSIRFFEAMQAGSVPVLIADDYVLPKGPDWERFLIRVEESKIRQLPEILSQYRPEATVRGGAAREAWEKWFAPDVWMDSMATAFGQIRETRRRPEREYRKTWNGWKARRWMGEGVRSLARNIFLPVVTFFNLRSYFRLNRIEK